MRVPYIASYTRTRALCLGRVGATKWASVFWRSDVEAKSVVFDDDGELGMEMEILFKVLKREKGGNEIEPNSIWISYRVYSTFKISRGRVYSFIRLSKSTNRLKVGIVDRRRRVLNVEWKLNRNLRLKSTCQISLFDNRNY